MQVVLAEKFSPERNSCVHALGVPKLAHMAPQHQMVLSGVIPTWTLGDRLRKAREHAGLNQSELADELGIARNSVGRYESGAYKPSRPVLIAWAFRTGVALDWLTETDVPVTNQDIPSGISASPGYTPVDNEITRLRKRLPLRGPVLTFLFGAAA